MVPNSSTTQEPTDAALRSRVEDLSLPPSELSHRAHLRLAWTYLIEEEDFGVAAVRFRTTLRRYTTAVGASAKYHETITWAYLALLRQAMDGRADRESNALLAAHPELLDHEGGALSRVLDVPAATADPLARRILVLPRRSP